MRYAAAYLLAILGGNASPDVAAIAKILASVGIECDENRAQKVVDACKGRDVNDIIASGLTKIDDALANTSVGTHTGGNASLPVPGIKPPSPPEIPVTPSPPGSPGSPGSGSFVSSYFHLPVFILINMFLFISNRLVCSTIEKKLSNPAKHQNKQELQDIILSFFSSVVH
jgi:large subunit ribosomal protein LP2